jgi:hypothetical protein
MGVVRRRMSSRMGILGTNPAVLVKVANKGLAGYGTWKRVRKMGDGGTRGDQEMNDVKEAARKGRMTRNLQVRRRVQRILTNHDSIKR